MIFQLYSLPLMDQKYRIIIFLLLSTNVFADDYQVDGSHSDKYALDPTSNQSTAAASITIAP